MSRSPPGVKTAAIYSRCVARPSLDLAPLTGQVAACLDLSLRNGWTVAGIFSDAGQSGDTLVGRAAFAEMLAAAERREFDYLVVSSMDSLARSQLLLNGIVERLTGLGISIWIVGTGLAVTAATFALEKLKFRALARRAMDAGEAGGRDSEAFANLLSAPAGEDQ